MRLHALPRTRRRAACHVPKKISTAALTVPKTKLWPTISVIVWESLRKMSNKNRRRIMFVPFHQQTKLCSGRLCLLALPSLAPDQFIDPEKKLDSRNHTAEQQAIKYDLVQEIDPTAMHTSRVRNFHPMATPQEEIHNDQTGAMHDNLRHRAKADPVRTKQIPRRSHHLRYCKQHDGPVNLIPNRRKFQEVCGWPKNEERMMLYFPQPHQCNRGSDDDGNGLEPRNLSRGLSCRISGNIQVQSEAAHRPFEVPTVWVLGQVMLYERENQRNDAPLNKELPQDGGEDFLNTDRVPACSQRREDCRDNHKCDSQVEGQYLDVEGEQRRANPLAAESQTAVALAIPARQKHGVAALFQERLLLSFRERAPKLSFFVLDFRADVVSNFFENVVPLHFRKAFSNEFQVAIDRFHDIAPYNIPSREELMACHSTSNCFRITLPSAESR